MRLTANGQIFENPKLRLISNTSKHYLLPLTYERNEMIGWFCNPSLPWSTYRSATMPGSDGLVRSSPTASEKISIHSERLLRQKRLRN